MARKRRVNWLSLFYVVVIFGLLLGSSLWLDSRGEPVVARVSGKRKRSPSRTSLTAAGSATTG